MQSLFEWDVRGYSEQQLAHAINRNIEEFGPGLEDSSFIFELTRDVIKEQDKLDLIITKAAPEWPLEAIAVVDRNILRIGLYELLFANKGEVPARVAINEAIELAKTFGGENSGRFVNGVLGAVYKEMGEPGKDDVPAKKKRPKDVPYDQMPIERLAGAVVWCRQGKGLALALVHDIFGYWTLSKGHLAEGEELVPGLERVLQEELSLKSLTVGEPLGDNEYISSDPEKGKIRKQVSYYLVEASHANELALAEKGGLDNARWFGLDEVGELRMYDDVVPFLTKALKLLTDRHAAR